jgi:hypothetical protein
MRKDNSQQRPIRDTRGHGQVEFALQCHQHHLRGIPFVVIYIFITEEPNVHQGPVEAGRVCPTRRLEVPVGVPGQKLPVPGVRSHSRAVQDIVRRYRLGALRQPGEHLRLERTTEMGVHLE